MGPPQLLVLLQPFAIIQGKGVSIQLMLIGFVPGNAVHRFTHSALSHSRGTQCCDKQGVIVTLKAIQALSLKLLTFFFPSLRLWWNVLSHPSAFRLWGEGKEPMFLLSRFKEGLFSNTVSPKPANPFKTPLSELEIWHSLLDCV